MPNNLYEIISPTDNTDQRSAPAANAAVVTTHDTNLLTNYSRGIMVNTAGDLKVDFVQSGTGITMTVLAGVVYPFHVKLIYATGTTATGITIFW